MLLNYEKVYWIYNASLPKDKGRVKKSTAIRRKKILDVFKDSTFTVNLIYKKFGGSYSTAKTDVLAMRESGQVVDFGKGQLRCAIGAAL